MFSARIPPSASKVLTDVLVYILLLGTGLSGVFHEEDADTAARLVHAAAAVSLVYIL